MREKTLGDEARTYAGPQHTQYKVYRCGEVVL